MIKYLIYCRKSSESEDRQMLSIDSQLDQAYKIATSLGVVVEQDNIITESKSAKTHNNRNGFKEVLNKIEKGEVSAIIVWHTDRLSRNSIDSAYLVELMDRGKLLEIVTPGQTFKNTPMDKFFFAFSCSQAKMENDKKGIDVRRGLEKCAEMGLYPSLAPIGYENDKYLPKGQKRIIKDPVRFDLVRKMWDLMLTGQYSPARIRDIATDKWGLRTKNGGKLAHSGVYLMFANPFYYGTFEYPRNSGKWRTGIHDAMITVEEFDKVQALLGWRGRPRPKKHNFDFTGLITCGECTASVTASFHRKKQKNGIIRDYIHYHCTKRKDKNCTQKSVNLIDLDAQILDEIKQIEIPEEFHAFAMKYVSQDNEKNVVDNIKIEDSRNRTLANIETKINKLVDLQTTGQISTDVFSRKNKEYLKEKSKLEDMVKNPDSIKKQSLHKFEEKLTFAEQAMHRFTKGTSEVRRTVLSTLGSNLTLIDKKLNINIDISLLPMKILSRELMHIKNKFGTINSIDKQRIFEQKCIQNPIVLPG